MSRMKSIAATACILGVLAFLLGTVPSMAQTKEAPKAMPKEAAKMEKAWYMVTSPHTKEECMQAIDGVAAQGAENLANWHWGCMSGDHTGYAIIHAASQEEALKQVPENIRAKAKAVKVDQFTLEQIKSMHEMAH